VANSRAAILAESANNVVSTGSRGCVGSYGTSNVKIGILHEDVAGVSCPRSALAILRKYKLSVTHQQKRVDTNRAVAGDLAIMYRVNNNGDTSAQT
jgi:hypothetical protein